MSTHEAGMRLTKLNAPTENTGREAFIVSIFGPGFEMRIAHSTAA